MTNSEKIHAVWSGASCQKSSGAYNTVSSAHIDSRQASVLTQEIDHEQSKDNG